MPAAPWRCTNCGAVYPEEGLPHRCPRCGGLFDRTTPPTWAPPKPGAGMWRYAASLPTPDGAEPVTLGEGGTPLLAGPEDGVWLKAEYLNPTGSHKDRAASLVFTWLRARGVTAIVEDSSGNAGAAWAAYAARSGLTAHIFVPAGASGPKRAQIEAFGARLHPVPGPRRAARDAAEDAARAGLGVYASHAWLPMPLDAYATIAYEIVADLGRAPGSVIVPVGHGSLLVGLMRGFRALRAAGRIERVPQVVGVQTLACAPLWAMSHGGYEAWLLVSDEAETVAEGVRVKDPVWGQAVAHEVHASQGLLAAVDDEATLRARDFLARHGFYIEPTAALGWAAYEAVRAHIAHPAVVLLTGSGHKTAAVPHAAPLPPAEPPPAPRPTPTWWQRLRQGWRRIFRT